MCGIRRYGRRSGCHRDCLRRPRTGRHACGLVRGLSSLPFALRSSVCKQALACEMRRFGGHRCGLSGGCRQLVVTAKVSGASSAGDLMSDNEDATALRPCLTRYGPEPTPTLRGPRTVKKALVDAGAGSWAAALPRQSMNRATRKQQRGLAAGFPAPVPLAPSSRLDPRILPRRPIPRVRSSVCTPVCADRRLGSALNPTSIPGMTC